MNIPKQRDHGNRPHHGQEDAERHQASIAAASLNDIAETSVAPTHSQPAPQEQKCCDGTDIPDLKKHLDLPHLLLYWGGDPKLPQITEKRSSDAAHFDGDHVPLWSVSVNHVLLLHLDYT